MEEQVKVLEGIVEMDYKWNPGSTVGRFLTDLRDKQEIVAVKCPRTFKTFLPPQAWSPVGQTKMEKFVTLTGRITLKAGTVVHRKAWNAPEGIELPYMIAAIAFEGADTELIHVVAGSEAQLSKLQPGTELKPVWREKRSGNIRDIDHFEEVR